MSTSTSAPRPAGHGVTIALGVVVVLLLITVGITLRVVLAGPRPTPPVSEPEPTAAGPRQTGSPQPTVRPQPVRPKPSANTPAVPTPAPEPSAPVTPSPPTVEPATPKLPVSATTPPPPAATKSVGPTLTPLEKQAVASVLRGVAYLRQTQNPNGSWGGGGHATGYAALPALALLECGVPPNDPAVQKAAQFVRQHYLMLNTTYELSLAVLFLDRLGDSRDTPLLQVLALRLIAGQNGHGGWSYHCPLLTRDEHIQLITFLRKHPPNPDPLPREKIPNLIPLDRPLALPNPLERPGLLPLPLPLEKVAGWPNPLEKPGSPLPLPLEKLLPGDLPNLIEKNGRVPTPLPTEPDEPPESPLPASAKPPGADKDPAPVAAAPGVDKSPTPAPVVPVPLPTAPLKGPPSKAREKELAKAKGKAAVAKGGTMPDRPAYLVQALPTFNDAARLGKGPKRDDNSNTHFAIMALWSARRHDVPMKLPLSLLDQRFRTSQLADGSWGYRYLGPGGARPSMTAVGLLGLGIGHGNFREAWLGGLQSPKAAKGPPLLDPAIQKGLRALGGQLSSGGKGKAEFDLYFLWTVERVALLYGLETIGGRDWYAWGAQHLLREQQSNGAWHTGSFNGSSAAIDTSMALLFLRRGNLFSDLSAGLRPFVVAQDPR